MRDGEKEEVENMEGIHRRERERKKKRREREIVWKRKRKEVKEGSRKRVRG